LARARMTDPAGKRGPGSVSRPAGSISSPVGRFARQNYLDLAYFGKPLRRNWAPLSPKCCRSDTATLLGAGGQDVLRWFILVVALLLDPAAALLLLAASSARR
jgi:hypothetical protein